MIFLSPDFKMVPDLEKEAVITGSRGAQMTTDKAVFIDTYVTSTKPHMAD